MISRRYENDGISTLKLNNTQLIAKSEVEKKITTGIYKFENVNCIICGSKSFETLAEKDRYGLSCSTRICTECGLVYTAPRMTMESYKEFYNSEYRRLYVGVEKAKDDFFYDQKFRGDRILKYIKNNSTFNERPLDILEVGCGAGGILYAFKLAGHKEYGIDFGEEYIDYGVKKYGLNLKVGSLLEIDVEYKADVIIYSHVLEHVLDIKNELNLIKSHLKNDGFVYVEVPGLKYIHKTYDMNFLKYLQNAHTYHFTLNSLNRVFTNNGFTKISGDEQIRSLFKTTLIETTINFKNEYNEVLKYIKKVEKFRFFYILRFKNLRWKLKKFVLKLIG